MTSEAKIEANRRNARLSTGPRTDAGKLASSRNALAHGVFAAAVVPGEDPGAWDAHRAGVLQSLAPVGLSEEVLAGRVALVLWRLDRVARFEAMTVTAGVQDAVLPTVPKPNSSLFPTPTIGQEIMRAAGAADQARYELKHIVPALECVEALAGRAGGEPVAGPVALRVLKVARKQLDHFVKTGVPPRAGSREFLTLVGHADTEPKEVPWTAGLLREALTAYSTFVKEESWEWLAKQVAGCLGREAGSLRKTAREQGDLAAGLKQREQSAPLWAAAARLVPGDGKGERVIRYESHLSKLLTTTLHELERLQAARAGRAAAVPLAVDITVMGMDAGGG